MRYLIPFLLFITLFHVKGQSNFPYSVELQAVSIPNLPGLHSFAFGQYDGKILLIGGRNDGLHARQPFNAFPANSNNTLLYVVDIENQQVYSSDLNSLSVSLQEQLQSTNMNFKQDGNTLFIIGGYGFSNTANDHITHPYLTSIALPEVISAIVDGLPFSQYFKQIQDPIFANTGGQLGKIGTIFYLVGGQKFDGRYNPMNHPTFTQTYNEKIQKFTIDNSGNQLSYANYTEIIDQVHLHRRDYNLVPQIFPDGSEGYTISSGVFQLNVDLPFLYPVDITANGHTPQTNFNQYLSNYHSAKSAMYDEENNVMYSIFYGGMSQYYYDQGNLVQDDNVPFVNTISMVSRDSNGDLAEFVLPEVMPSLEGASAEFIPNHDLPYTTSEVLRLNDLSEDSSIIGYILGGIHSNSLKPFTANNTADTEASSTLYAVKLRSTNVDTSTTAIRVRTNEDQFHFQVSPNTASKQINLTFNLAKLVGVDCFITDMTGKILLSKELFVQRGENHLELAVDKSWDTPYIMVNLSFADKYYVSKKVMLK